MFRPSESSALRRRPSRLTAHLVLAVTLAGAWMPPARACNDGNRGGMQMVAAKRVGPAPVAPVVVDGLRIEAVNAGRKRGLAQNGGYIEAFDMASGKSLWLLQVYKIDYAANMEEDVQDRFIKQLESTADRASLLVTDENGNRFIVDLTTRAVSAAPSDAPRTGIR